MKADCIALRSGCLVDVVVIVWIQWFSDFNSRVISFSFLIIMLLFRPSRPEAHYSADKEHRAQHGKLRDRPCAEYPEIDLVHVFHEDNRNQHGQYNDGNGFYTHGFL